MAKFINKKEQVYDLKLTNYGHYLLSIGKMEPVYYAFFDDNIIYDGEYAGITEAQNSVVNRVRNESQYIESLVTFQDVEKQLNTLVTSSSGLSYYQLDVEPMRIEPRVENYRFDAAIGDAYLEGDTQAAPAWKIVALEGEISSSSQKDTKNQVNIPQINIQLNYSLVVEEYDPSILLSEQDFREVAVTTEPFIDNRVIKLQREDLMVYGDEINTALLTENFDIEVFEIKKDEYPASCDTHCSTKDVLKRKYFSNKNTSIKGGLMKVEESLDGSLLAVNEDDRPTASITTEPTRDSVSYYFDILKDSEILPSRACKAASEFNKNSYYVDLDFDCEKYSDTEPFVGDIYGKVTEPEICL